MRIKNFRVKTKTNEGKSEKSSKIQIIEDALISRQEKASDDSISQMLLIFAFLKIKNEFSFSSNSLIFL